jgi:hypothetical protein
VFSSQSLSFMRYGTDDFTWVMAVRGYSTRLNHMPIIQFIQATNSDCVHDLCRVLILVTIFSLICTDCYVGCTGGAS